MRIFFVVVCLFISPSVFAQYKSETYPVAYNHIRVLKKSAVFVRLHTDDMVLDKLKRMKQYKTLEARKEEIYANNKETYAAFTSAFTFAPVYFFYGRDSDKVRNRDFFNIFLNEELVPDSTIKFSSDSTFFIIDVGDIYFDAFGGHFEGMAVMDSRFEPLKKPFPYYVRKRSGISIITRTDLEMVLILQKELEEFFEESKSPKF